MVKPDNILPDPQLLRRSTAIMRALAHPLRLRMIALLRQDDSACVHTIHTALGIEQSVASQHLRILRQAGLVLTERKGKFVYYLINEPLLLKTGDIAVQLSKLV